MIEPTLTSTILNVWTIWARELAVYYKAGFKFGRVKVNLWKVRCNDEVGWGVKFFADLFHFFAREWLLVC